MASPTSPKSFHWTFDQPDALQRWGTSFASALRVGDVIALVGSLGAGKTTLVQGIARGLGYIGNAVSPTFALVNEYKTAKGNVYHMDMYRLSAAENRVFPVEEYWDNGICLVEWGDRIRSRWPAETLEVRLAIRPKQKRFLTIPSPSPRWQTRLRATLLSD